MQNPDIKNNPSSTVEPSESGQPAAMPRLAGETARGPHNSEPKCHGANQCSSLDFKGIHCLAEDLIPNVFLAWGWI